MKRILCLSLFLFPALLFAQPCTTSNAGGCDCPDGSTDCDLLPDITVSWYALQTYMNGPTEYSQTGNGANNGRLRLSGSTPNIGWGPFTVRGVDANGYRWFVCGSDTSSVYDPGSNVVYTCPNGNPTPKQIIFQRVYHKSNGIMTYSEHMSGTMTYHPTHGHNHVDDWAIFTLRSEDPNEPDTLKWPIVGTGAKVGFCLMDYGSCDNYTGHCRNRQPYNGGTVLTSPNFPNYGLGGGQYNCSPIEQGISVGYTDIYDETLDGMWINIPPNTCNGNYWIVVEVDPHNYFIEMNDNNNWTAIPITLTKQLPAGSAVATIRADRSPYVCNSSPVTLLSSGATSYLWSTGDTTSSISVTTPGNYFVQTNSLCGHAISDTLTITGINSQITTTGEDTTCVSGALTLTAQGTGQVSWYDTVAGGNLLSTGNTYTTPTLQATATYYAENVSPIPGLVAHSQPTDHPGGSQYSSTNFNSYLIFDCLSAFTLKSVKVYTGSPGTRTIEWRNSSGVVLADTTINIPAGTSRINLNFHIPPGTNYQLGTNAVLNNTNFGYNSPALMRSSSGLSYPYMITDVLSIHDTDNGTAFYYYFYDWEVEYGAGTCPSHRAPVHAVVSPLPTVSITGLDSTYQVNASVVTMTGQPAGGTFSGDGVSGNTFDPLQAGIGIHTVTYSYSNGAACSNSTSVNVHVHSGQIVASAGDNTEICIGASATLIATGGTHFLWSTGEQTDSIVVTPVITSTYSVTVSDGSGGADVADVTVTVNPLPTVDITGLAASYFVNENPVTLSANPSGGTFAGDGVTGNTFQPGTAGVGFHWITYTYADVHGCAATDTAQVEVKQSQVVASAGPDVEICLNESTVLTASGGTEFNWSTGQQSATITVSPVETTTYTVTVSDNSGDSDMAQVAVTVYPLPTVDFSGLLTEYFDNEAPATMTGLPTNGTFSGPGVSGNTFSPGEAGIGGPYSITYSFTDANGCSNSAVKTVLVKEFTSVPSILADNIRVYPNPTHDYLMLDFSDLQDKDVTVKLWDAVGKELVEMPLSLTVAHLQSKLNLTNVPKGIYFLEVVTQEGAFTQKVVRE